MNKNIKNIKIMNPLRTHALLEEVDIMLNRSLKKLFKTKTVGDVVLSNRPYQFDSYNDDTKLADVLTNYKIKILIDEKIISEEYANKLLEIYNEYLLLDKSEEFNKKYFEYKSFLNEFGLIDNDFCFSEMFKESYIKSLRKK